MANQQKTVVRTSGWVPLLILPIMAAVGFVLYLTVAEIFAKGATIIHIVGVVWFMWMETYFFRVIVKPQKIELDRTTLTIQMLIKGSEFYPKFETNQIDLSEIQSVVIARIKYFKKHAKEFQDMNLIEKIKKEQNIGTAIATQAGPIPISLRSASAYFVLMYILPKDSTKKTIVVKMGSFTKKNIMRLIREFRDFGIPVTVEPALVTKKFS